MSTLPACIPASMFSRPDWRILPPPPVFPSGKPPLEDDGYVPRYPPSANVSIHRLREAINSLDCKMAALLTQRNELELHLEQAVRSQSPVLRLPSELLSTIFVKGVLGMGAEEPIMVSTLMLVCRYWAEVALNTPQLWTKIVISPHHPVERARRKLERSKTCPIDVSVDFGQRPEYARNAMDQLIRAMDLLRPAICRVRSFHLAVPDRPHAHAALMRCREDAPLLEVLSVQVHKALEEESKTTPELPLFNGRTPRLRSCSLTSFQCGWDPVLFTRLRVLKLVGYYNHALPPAHTLLEILSRCPELEEFTLHNVTESELTSCRSISGSNRAYTTTPIHLPRLKKASFNCCDRELATQVIRHIAFPALESLDLRLLHNITAILHKLGDQALVKLPLKSLRIESCVFDEIHLLKLLRHLPSLTTLEVIDVDDLTSMFLKNLASPQPWICPKLENLSLEGCLSLEWESVRTLVESRLPANSQAYVRNSSVPLPPGITLISSASAAAAAAQARSKSTSTVRVPQASVMFGPQRLKTIDVTSCTQISTEMRSWLRMYVADVRCRPTKGTWGGSALS